MLGLPKTTEMSKQLPKKAIYTKFQMNTAAKEKIDADLLYLLLPAHPLEGVTLSLIQMYM